MEMSIDDMIELEEQARFEDQFADELDALNEFEDCDLPNLRPEKVVQPTQPKGTSRKLFENDFLEGDGDLIIEEEDEITAIKKRNRIDEEDETDFPSAKKPSMPTTLDMDRDEIRRKRKEEKHKDEIGSPEIINKILRKRECLNKKTSEVLQNGLSLSTEGGKRTRIELTKVLTHPPRCNYMPLTSSDGQRFYMRLRDSRNNSNHITTTTNNFGSLLLNDIATMRQAVQNQKLKALYQDSMRITQDVRNLQHGINQTEELEALNQVLDADSSIDAQALALDTSLEQSVNTEEIVADSHVEEKATGLWLNKYAPTQYAHLLSDETVNRALLKWLKMWDPVVFNREYKPKQNKQEDEANNYQNRFKKFNILEHIDDKVDEYKRPIWKAALLCGPPGLGKTTLAHIIAKHAGYHVVEMNASDDRSADAFRTKLEETTEMTSVLADNGKPNCLIIDEIDGAPVAAINVLLAAMNKGKEKKKAKPGKIKRKQTGSVLLRPVICICNDLYTPALRQLKQQSLILHFPPTASSTLAIRLSQLCRLQSLQCDTTTLLALCEKSQNDIRSCINTLQFIQSQGAKRLGISTIKSMEIGQKDQHKSIFTVWNEIFQLPKNKRKMDQDTESLKLDSHLANQSISQFSARFYTIYHLVSANGDYNKTMQGVFENFLSLKFKDPDMSGLRRTYNWIQLFDQVNSVVLSHQEYILYQYIPFLFVLIHLLFACVSVPKLQYPTSNTEFLKKQAQSQNLLKMMFCEMIPSVQCFASPSNLVLDILPYLMTVVSPQMRPVNTQLFNQLEKQQMRDLVQTMLAYNLAYRQERDEDEKYNYVLEPNMLEVCRYPDTQAHSILSYATKQMISKEVETEKMRRSEQMMQSRSTPPNTTKVVDNVKTPKKVTSTKPTESKQQTHVPNHLQRLEDSIANSQIKKEKPVIDFFSRFKKVKQVEVDEKNKPGEKKVKDPGIGNSHIWYRYNEGYSNAVRRTVFVKDFI